MLQISEAAKAVIRQVRTENELPDTTAMRISAVDVPGGIGIGFTFTQGPEAGDQAIAEQEDFRVYLASELAVPLSDAVLEATEAGGGLELRTHSGDHRHDHESHQDHLHH